MSKEKNTRYFALLTFEDGKKWSGVVEYGSVYLAFNRLFKEPTVSEARIRPIYNPSYCNEDFDDEKCFTAKRSDTTISGEDIDIKEEKAEVLQEWREDSKEIRSQLKIQF